LGGAEALIPPSDKQLRAELAFARGDCSFSSPALAKKYFAQARDLAQTVDPFLAASALGNLSYLAMNEGNYADAIEKANQVLLLTDSPLVQEKTQDNLSISYSHLGDYRMAIQFAREAVSTAHQLAQVNDEARALVALGHSLSALHEDSEAETHLLRGLSLARTTGDSDTEYWCLNNLAHLTVRRHQLDKAEEYWKQEISIPGKKDEPYTLLNREEIERARGNHGRAELILQQILHRNISDGLRAVAKGDLGAVYAAQHKYDLAERAFLEGIQIAEEMRKRLPEEYRMSFLDYDDFYDGYVSLMIDRHKPLRALQVAERGRSRTLLEGLEPQIRPSRDFNLRAVQAFLRKNDEELLSYWATESKSFLWVITGTEFRLFHLPGHEKLYEQVRQANQEIQDRKPLEESEKGQALYRTLIQSASKLIRKGSRVIIIPSRVLSLVSFDSLVVPGNKPHYWIEDVDIENANSIALLTAPWHRVSSYKKGMLLIGAPVEVSKDFPALRHADDEMDLIAKRFARERETAFSGKNATPQAYLASHPQQYRFIHFVTHGTADRANPMKSVIVLSGTPQSYKLYARDIVKVPIDSELVTISACYGAGLRWYMNESTVGLGWAFMRAGAHQVVAALWEVDDAGTPEFMNQFYAQINNGQSPAEALRAVKLEAIHSLGPHKHPYFWASLQLYRGA
jgi:CHAT domain-containing protein/Tfp pilus assembly protein PilF